MVATLSNTRSKPTKEEAIYMIKSAPCISTYGETVPCPRCGQTLLYEQIGYSYVVKCSDESCIRTGCRGI